MNLTELNDQFEVLFEDLATDGSKGLNSYERSLCFTYAQEQIVRELAQAWMLDPITSLVTTDEQTNKLTSVYGTAVEFSKVNDPFHVLGYFLKSNDVNQGEIGVRPVSMEFINRTILFGPYKYPPKDLAYVVMGETKLTVFPPFNYDTKSLVTRYIQKPAPIILEALTGGLTIDTLTGPSNPSITSSFHTVLVEKAVKFAIEIYIGVQEQEVNDSKGDQ